MATVHELSRTEARRVAVRAQLLTQEQRRWGYYALPILCGDRLIGKLDARADHKAGVLRVAAIHQDVPFSSTIAAAVDHEIRDLARWLDLELVLPE